MFFSLTDPLDSPSWAKNIHTKDWEKCKIGPYGLRF